MPTTYFQTPIHPTDPTAVALPVSTPDGPLATWVDEDVADDLDGRKLSLGSHGYPAVWHESSMWPLHRVIMGLKVRDGLFVDHLSGDRLDNRRANLRIVTAAENAANRRCTSRTGYRGVRAAGSKFVAYAKRDGINVYLGTFDDIEQAAEVSHAWRALYLPGYTGNARTRYSRTPQMLAAVVAAEERN
ncbi:HNH endonuclease signature motif containing protein [Nonomuraea bangladeshensis]|uniref:HNH endonuclease signature motif containing protein n=1 Tax=Nonomuraea bangladeshensis TaxID=404385 RepID=UPI0031D6A628